jgi:thiamine biosynthesis lipoprotein
VTTRRQALRITAVAGLGLAFGGAVTAGIFRMSGLRRVRATRTQMAMRVTITAIHPDVAFAREMVDDAFAEIERLEGVLSRHRPGTALDQLNRKGIVYDAPEELLAVLATSRRFSELTGGAFDPTIAPVLALYERELAASGGLPAAAEIDEALALVDYRAVVVVGKTVRFEKPGMTLTLDGIGKGFIVDRAADGLVAAGADRVMVEAGGDVATSGGPGDGFDGWQLAVQDPRSANGVLGVLTVDGEAVSTSGDYVHSFSDDREAHHIVDPRTGRSPEGASAATIIAPTAMESDALSTGVMVLGPAEGVALLDSLDGVEGLIITKEGRALRSAGIDRYLS